MSQIWSKNIYFKPLPKYELMVKIVNPTIIEEINSCGTYIYFDHNPYNVKTLLDQKSFYSLQTQLRFCYLTYDQKEVKDCGPEHLSISLNGRIIYSFTEESNNQIKEPIDLSNYCLSQSKNVLRFWMNRPDIIWSIPSAFEISLVKCHSPQSVFNRINNCLNQYLSFNYTKDMIEKRFSNDYQSSDDIEILAEGVKCSLICPISGSRLETACRTNDCEHIQCFDLLSFLKMSDTKYDWLCPICNKPAEPKLLRIDRFFNDILSQTDRSLNEIQFNSDHSWIASISNSENENILDDTITLDEDSFVETLREKTVTPNRVSLNSKISAPHKSNKNSVINLNNKFVDFKHKPFDYSAYGEVEKIRK